MAKFISTKTNFSSGKLSDKLLGRPDIKEYENGCSEFTNAYTDLSGGAVKRQGIIPAPTNGFIRSGIPIKTFMVSPKFGYHFHISINRFVSIPTYIDKMLVSRVEEDGSLTTLASRDLLGGLLAEAYSPSEYHLSTINNLSVLTHCSGQLMPVFALIIDELTVQITDLYNAIPLQDLPHTTPAPLDFQYDQANQKLVAASASTAAALSGKTISVRQSEWGFPTQGSYSVCYTTIELSAAVGLDIPIASPIEASFDLAGYGKYFMIEQGSQDEVFFADWGAGNWPFTSVTHQGRLIFLGSPANPEKVWASRLNGLSFNYVPYYNIDTPSPRILETDHFVFTISGFKGSRLVAGATLGRGIVAGTTGGSSFIFPMQTALSPYDFNVEKLNSVPVGTVEPVMADEYAVFEAGGKNSLLLAVADQSGIPSIIDLDAQIDKLSGRPQVMSHNPVLNVTTIIDDLGNVYSLSLKKQTGTIAFGDVSYTIPEGVLTTVAYWKDGKDVYDGVAGVVYTTFLGNAGSTLTDQIATILGGLSEDLEKDVSLFHYLDLAQVEDNDVRVSGDTDLAEVFRDRELYVLAIKDGATVFKGKLTANGLRLPDTLPDYDAIIFGLPFAMRIATMPIESGAQWGTAQLGLKRIDKVGIWYYNSTSFELSSDGYNTETVEIDDFSTGRKEIPFTASSEVDQRVHITHEGLGPCHITSLSMRGVSNDG